MSPPQSQGRQDATRDRIEAGLAAPLAQLGFDVEAVELTPAGKRRMLRVAVDKDGGVILDDLAVAARTVSAVLDQANLLGEQPYTLEVTSRGVDRPLTRPRHWRRNAGRLVKLTLTTREQVTGRVTTSTESTVVLAVADRPREIAYDDIAKALVQIEFNPPRTDKES